MRMDRRVAFVGCLLLAGAVLVVVGVLSTMEHGRHAGTGQPSGPATVATGGAAAGLVMPALPWSQDELRAAYRRSQLFLDLFANVAPDDRVADRLTQLEQYVDPQAVHTVAAQYDQQRALTRDGASARYSLITARWRLVAASQVSLVVDGQLEIRHDGRTTGTRASFAIDLGRSGSTWLVTWIGDPAEADAGVPAG